MATLIAVDGHSLNYELRRKARSLHSEGTKVPHHQGKPRLVLDYKRLKNFLTSYADDNVKLRYYIDQAETKPTKRLLGRCTYWNTKKGYGFIMDPEGTSHFAHYNALATDGFKKLNKGQLASFETKETEQGLQAVDIRLEENDSSNDTYRKLRKESFFSSLSNLGYEIIRCHYCADDPGKKSKSVDLRICADVFLELPPLESSTLILVTDDVVFVEMFKQLSSTGINTIIASFASRRSLKLSQAAKQSIILDDYLDQITMQNETALNHG